MIPTGETDSIIKKLEKSVGFEMKLPCPFKMNGESLLWFDLMQYLIFLYFFSLSRFVAGFVSMGVQPDGS